MRSVTGYVITEKIDTIKNTYSLIFLLLGIFGYLFYLAKFR
jgi:hypothetical protein